MTARKIKAMVEYGLDGETEILDLPDDWDDWTDARQQDYLTDCAVTLQNNVAPCSAIVVEVDSDGAEVGEE